MALELKPECERCEASLDHDSHAYICSFECTFCKECTEKIEFRCPNCQGELVRRPRRSA